MLNLGALLLIVLTAQAFYLVSVLSVANMDRVVMQTLRPRDDMNKTGPVTNKDQMHTVTFAIKERNKDVLEQETLARSTPGNKMYGKWMTKDQVAELIGNPDGTQTVRDWLAPYESISISKERTNYLDATAPVSVWEELFATEFFVWEGDGHTLARADQYSLPANIAPSVNAVFGVAELPVKVKRGPSKPAAQAAGMQRHHIVVSREAREQERHAELLDVSKPAAASWDQK
jgi:subtilase family serine protease